MADPLSVVAGAIAVIQITDRVIALCKTYIQGIRNAPQDLRTILVETSALKSVLENVELLVACDDEVSTAMEKMVGRNGPVENCRRVMQDMENLFPVMEQQTDTVRSKRQKLATSLEALAWPFKASKARDYLDKLMRYKSAIIATITTGIAQDVKVIKHTSDNILNAVSDSQRFAFYTWLEHTDPSSLHQLALSRYEDGTGHWVLRTREWQDWVAGKTRALWLNGIPGSGKTVLVSHLIEELRAKLRPTDIESTPVIYYYCYFDHNQDEEIPFLRWILACLCRRAKVVSKTVYDFYEYGGQPGSNDLLNGIEEVSVLFERVFIVLDAMDESFPRHGLLEVLRQLAAADRFEKIQLLSSSRIYTDIESNMLQISKSISMSNGHVEEDIKIFVLSSLAVNPKFDRCSSNLREEIGQALSVGAKGM